MPTQESPPATDEQIELAELAAEIRDYASAQKISDSQLERRFGGIGSSTTLNRILAGEWSKVNAENHLPNYRGVVQLLREVEQSARRNEELYGTLNRVLKIESAVKQALKNEDNTRLVMVQGPTGSGKSTGLALVAQKLRGYDVLFTEADESWRESLLCMSSQLLRELRGAVRLRGEKGSGDASREHGSAGRAMEDVLKRIADRKMVLVLDQADELGPRTLNFCTTLINKCPRLVLVLACLETLWKDLERSHYEVARQLSQNRLSERVVIGPAHPDSKDWMNDSTMILKARLKWSAGDSLSDAARLIAEKAGSRGNLKFLTLVIRHAREQFEDGLVPSHEQFIKVVNRIIGSR